MGSLSENSVFEVFDLYWWLSMAYYPGCKMKGRNTSKICVFSIYRNIKIYLLNIHNIYL